LKSLSLDQGTKLGEKEQMKPKSAPNTRLMVAPPETFLHPSGHRVEWLISDRAVPYETALQRMESHVEAMIRDQASERVWLLEHPALYTAGTSADRADVLQSDFPVYQTGRGGQMTYHGPGQRIAYVMLDLRARGQDLRRFIAALEGWIIEGLAQLNIKGERREDRVGVWVQRPDKGIGHEDKIAAIGIRVRQWVTFHGISINIDPDLSHFNGIIPCGVENPDFGVTSLTDMGHLMLMSEFDIIFRQAFERIFGPTQTVFEKE
jgi:lipoyl(octanoyl) transferase